jgi:hypothetical protein
MWNQRYDKKKGLSQVYLNMPPEDLLDGEAALRRITRQSLIKVWLYERLESNAKSLSQK